MREKLSSAPIGAIVGTVILAVVGCILSLWTAIEARGVGSEDTLMVISWQAFKVFGLLIPCGTVVGAAAGGILGLSRRNQPRTGIMIQALRGGMVMGVIGVVLGTLMGLAYGRDWGRAPTPMAVVAFWFMFGIPAAIIGAIGGAIIGGFLATIRGSG